MLQTLHAWRALAAALIFLAVFAPLSAQAQTDSSAPTDSVAEWRSGTAVLTGWPDGWPAAAVRDSADMLPALDSLTLDYRTAAGPDAPQMAFTVRWAPGDHGYDRGRRVTAKALPELRMTRLALSADVVSGGRRVGGVVVAIDSMRLAARPDAFAFDAAGLSYATVFAGASADSARMAFAEGFTLENLTIERIGFAPVPQKRRTADRHPRRAPAPVYVPRPAIDIGIGWVIRPRPRIADGGGAPPSDGRTSGPRRAGRGDDDERRPGRDGSGEDAREARGGGEDDGDTEKRGRRSGRDDDDDDGDDEDDESLRPAAAVAAMAVGAVAVGGGSVGVYGTTEAPFGVMAGYADARGGAFLQASVNGALLFGEEGGDAQRLTAKALVFYDVGGGPVQPALGLGVRARAGDDTHLDPSLTLGAALNLGRVVAVGGYDVLGEAAEVGVVVNFRAWP